MFQIPPSEIVWLATGPTAEDLVPAPGDPACAMQPLGSSKGRRGQRVTMSSAA